LHLVGDLFELVEREVTENIWEISGGQSAPPDVYFVFPK
jgi:hypothetical protein